MGKYAQSKVKYGSLTVRNHIPHSSRKDILGSVYLCCIDIDNFTTLSYNTTIILLRSGCNLKRYYILYLATEQWTGVREISRSTRLIFFVLFLDSRSRAKESLDIIYYIYAYNYYTRYTYIFEYKVFHGIFFFFAFRVPPRNSPAARQPVLR